MVHSCLAFLRIETVCFIVKIVYSRAAGLCCAHCCSALLSPRLHLRRTYCFPRVFSFHYLSPRTFIFSLAFALIRSLRLKMLTVLRLHCSKLMARTATRTVRPFAQCNVCVCVCRLTSTPPSSHKERTYVLSQKAHSESTYIFQQKILKEEELVRTWRWRCLFVQNSSQPRRHTTKICILQIFLFRFSVTSFNRIAIGVNVLFVWTIFKKRRERNRIKNGVCRVRCAFYSNKSRPTLYHQITPSR